MANERITENLVRDHLRQFSGMSGLHIEEQQSNRPGVGALLRTASKAGSGIGRPEFIITLEDQPSLVMVVECKADPTHHISPRLVSGDPSNPGDAAKFAVDGVRHYAAALSKKFDVVAIAVSGSACDLRVSAYRHLRGEKDPDELVNDLGVPITALLSPGEYVRWLTYDPAVARRSLDELMQFSRLVHNFMRDYAKLSEPEKPLVVSAILLALQDRVFEASWSQAAHDQLAQVLLNAVERTTKRAILDADRRELMLAAYQFIATHPELGQPTSINTKLNPSGRRTVEDTSPLRVLIRELQAEVIPFVQTYPGIDVVGQFYGEFLRYTGGDGKGLGIVLTPRHLTELFAEIIQVGPNDTVVDVCAGTGGFLISAMQRMDRFANTDGEKIQIRERQIVGVEQRTDMYAMCASNMILRGDGRSNLYRGNCFSISIQQALTDGSGKGHSRPNKGLLNPPFSQKGDKQHELDFVKAMMDTLSPGGLGIAVVPMSCAIAPHPARERLLKEHSLVAVMSLPDELFYPVGTITCAMVLRAGEPHSSNSAPTWFGYWKDDGFVKTKHRGRQDLHGNWESVRTSWLEDFSYRREVPGRCVQRTVTVDDEWCAEAYLETNYSNLSVKEFEGVVADYALYVAQSQWRAAPDDPADEGE